MNRKKGAISIFALLSMMFFLIFIMVAYNNVSQKGKTQVETEGILVNYYKSERTATEIVNSLKTDLPNANKATTVRGGGNVDAIKNATAGTYILANGKCYLVK